MAVTQSSYGKAKTWKATDAAYFGSVYATAAAPTLRGLKCYLRTVIAFSLIRASGLCHG